MMHALIRAAAPLFGGNCGKAPKGEVRPQVLRVDTGPLSHEVLAWPGGDALPVVLLHGLQNTGWIWARCGHLLQGRRRVYAPTMRGHGATQGGSGSFDLAVTSDDLERLVDRLDIGRFHLAGHSWGGKVAFHFAATHADRVASLSLCDPVPPRGLNPMLRTFPGLIRAAFEPERRTFPDRTALLSAMAGLVYLRVGDETDRAVWQAKFEEDEAGGYRPRLTDEGFAAIMEQVLPVDIEPLAAQVDAPVLLLRPHFNVSFWPGELRALRRTLPGLRTGRIAGDHTFIHSNALDTSAALGAFLDIAGGSCSTSAP